MANKRILQITLAVIAIVPILTGLLGMLPAGMSDGFYGIALNSANQGNVILDSNYRYYSGLWLALGIVMIWIIPSIERQTVTLRILSFMIFVGGVGRVIGMIAFAVPHPAFVFFTIIELLFPLVILWQNKVASAGVHSNS